jgi:hypothetical protein
MKMRRKLIEEFVIFIDNKMKETIAPLRSHSISPLNKSQPHLSDSYVSQD